MPNSNRRKFQKNAGQSTLAAGMGLGLPGRASPNAYDAENTKNGNLSWPYPTAYAKETEIDVDVVVLGGGVSGC